MAEDNKNEIYFKGYLIKARPEELMCIRSSDMWSMLAVRLWSHTPAWVCVVRSCFKRQFSQKSYIVCLGPRLSRSHLITFTTCILLFKSNSFFFWFLFDFWSNHKEKSPSDSLAAFVCITYLGNIYFIEGNAYAAMNDLHLEFYWQHQNSWVEWTWKWQQLLCWFFFSYLIT